MIKRRTFLGSVTAMVAAGASNMVDPSRVHSAMVPVVGANRLDWDCQVIEAISHRSDRDKPVVTGVDVDSEGRLMAVVGDDHFVSVYNFQDGEFSEHLDRHTDWVRTAKFSHVGDTLATAGNDRQLFIWDANDLSAPVARKKNPEAIIDVAFSSDDSKIATVGFETWLRILDARDGSQILKLDCACPDNHAVAFSADGQLVAAAGRSGHVRIWNVSTGTQTAQYKPHRKRVRSLEFSNDGLVVSGGDDQSVAIVDPKNTKNIRRLPRLASKLYSVQLMPDGLIAVGGSDNQIHISRLADGTAIGSLEGHTGTVSSLSLKGEKLVSGSYDTQVRIWSPTIDVRAPGNQARDRHTQLDQGWTNKR